MLKTAASEKWLDCKDGFSLCTQPLSALLEEKGICDTGISSRNPADVESYFDDWHLYRVSRKETVYGLVKLREQEHDYVPGFSDRDDPSVTVSFIPFPIALLESLPYESQPGQPEMTAFVSAFRDVTERFPQRHSPLLQAYFSDPESFGSYLIAKTYIKKLLTLHPNGSVPFPDKYILASSRLLRGLGEIERRAGHPILDIQNQALVIADPAKPTLEEQQAILALHTGNLSFNSFAAEVKFHADALVKWQAHIPFAGFRIWYRAAIRADMQFGPENKLYSLFFCPYYRPGSKLTRQQETIRGKQ